MDGAGHILAHSTRPVMVLCLFVDHHWHLYGDWHCVGSIPANVEVAGHQLSGGKAIVNMMATTRKPGAFEEAQIMAELVRHRFYIKGDARGIRADLSFRNMAGLVLKDQGLKNIILKGTNLSGADLSGCDLSGADLFGADLEGANLQGAKLTGVDFRGANLTRAILSNCHLQGSDFSSGGDSGDDNTRLTEAKLDHAMLCEANLNGCDMSGAELIDADLTGADLSKAVLIGAELSGAQLDNVRLDNTVIEISRLSLAQRDQVGSIDGIVKPAYLDISEAAIKLAVGNHTEWIESGGKNGRRLELEGIRISSYSFRGMNLAGARFRRCSFNGLDMSGVVLDMADLTYADLTHTNLKRASLRGTTLRGADLSNSDMSGARIEAMVLKGNKLWPANLDGALIQNCDLTNASFAHSIMNYADLTGSILFGANFIDVDLTKVKNVKSNDTQESASCRRIAKRYSIPKLYVKTSLGVFPTVNWSTSGICISYVGDARFEQDSNIRVKIVADGYPPPRDAEFTVIRDDQSRGVVLLKFLNSDEGMIQYLNSVAPDDII